MLKDCPNNLDSGVSDPVLHNRDVKVDIAEMQTVCELTLDRERERGKEGKGEREREREIVPEATTV